MLINFEVNNFLSFNKKNEFSMEPGENLRKYPNNVRAISVGTKKKDAVRLLKNTVIFGENGAGKSNLLSALRMMRNIVTNILPRVTDKLQQPAFELDSNSRSTTFSVEIVQNGERYKYSFEYTTSSIINEQLDFYEDSKFKNYFRRSNTNNYKTPKHLEAFTEETRKNVLFLQTAQSKNDAKAAAVFEWFEDSLIFFDEDSSKKLYSFLDNNHNKKLFLNFMKLADQNMIDVVIEDSIQKPPAEMIEAFETLESITKGAFKFEIPREHVTKELYTIYRKYDSNGERSGEAKIPLKLESTGTRKLIAIVLNVLSYHNSNKVILMDEFDDSLHEQLSEALIKIFNSKANNNQFIVTSHELTLMDAGLRKDQIYFIQKNFAGESQIFSVFDFNDTSKNRGDFKYYRRYMKGMFGAIPNIDANSFLSLLEEGNSNG